MSHRARSAITVCAALTALAAGTALWTAGAITIPPPWALRAILATAGAAGLVSAALALSNVPGRRRGGLLAGAAALTAVALFLLALFRKPDGPVEILRRVAPPQPSITALRLVSWNVLHGYPPSPGNDPERRAERLAAALRALDPTVVVLQEAWAYSGRGALAERLGRELGYDVAYAAANGSRRLIGFEEGSAVLSRLPILDARRVALAPREAPWRLRIALIVTLAVRHDERLTVVGTHLANDAPAVAADQGRDLAARLPAGGPLIVAGDLNDGDGPAVAAFTAAGLVDLLPGGIDHVLWRAAPESGWVVRDARWTLRPQDLQDLLGLEEGISDHDAILVDLERAPP